MTTAIRQTTGLSGLPPNFALPSGVSEDEITKLLPTIKCLFDPIVAKYQEQKYSPDIYRDLLTTFKKPTKVKAADIRRALLWKYGKRKGNKLPPNQSSTIIRIIAQWSKFCAASSFEEKLDALTAPDKKRNDFVSRAFFLHLIEPAQFPIIDRYNHRAVRYLLGMSRAGFLLGALPNCYDDIVLAHNFIEQVRKTWGGTAPSRSDVDRYLMMFGKHIAPNY